MQEGLRDYLDAEKADPADLISPAAFSGSRLSSAPPSMLLSRLSASTRLSSCRSTTATRSLQTSYPPEIPFPPNSEGREIVQRVFETKGLWNAQSRAVRHRFTPVGHIDLFSVLTEPYEPSFSTP